MYRRGANSIERLAARSKGEESLTEAAQTRLMPMEIRWQQMIGEPDRKQKLAK